MTKMGQLLKLHREGSSLTQREVAKALKISHVFYGEIERGQRYSLPKKHWPKALAVFPLLTVRELDKADMLSRDKFLRELKGMRAEEEELLYTLYKSIEQRRLSYTDSNQLLKTLQEMVYD